MHFHYCTWTGSIKPSLQYFHNCHVRWLLKFPFYRSKKFPFYRSKHILDNSYGFYGWCIIVISFWHFLCYISPYKRCACACSFSYIITKVADDIEFCVESKDWKCSYITMHCYMHVKLRIITDKTTTTKTHIFCSHHTLNHF
jgi:hypothetical protein